MNNLPQGLSGGIQYRAQVQNIGWQGWVSDGAIAGTVKQSLRLEAIQIELTGQLAQNYSVSYRAQVQNIGWQGSVSDGTTAGTVGQGLRLEALKISLIPKIHYCWSYDNQYYTYSDVQGDVDYPQFEYLDSTGKPNRVYQNNNTYAVYNNAVYNFNVLLLQQAKNADYEDWQARQNWNDELNQYNQTINSEQATLNSATAQENQYQAFVNQEQTYLAEEQQKGLPMSEDQTLLSQYQTNLVNAQANVASATQTLQTEQNALNAFKAIGTDFVNLSYAVTYDNTGKSVTVNFTQITQIAGQQTPWNWTETAILHS